MKMQALKGLAVAAFIVMLGASSAKASTFAVLICVTKVLGSLPVVFAQDTEQKVTVDGVVRTFTVHLPKGYDSQQHYPVVLLLHSDDQEADDMVRLSHFNDVADRYGIIAVYPNAFERRWNVGVPAERRSRPGGGGFGGRGIGGLGIPGIGLGGGRHGGGGGQGPSQDEEARVPRANDVAFFDQMLDTLSSQYSVDAERIYATGLSDGGFMDFRLGCSMATRIAAIAPVGAEMPKDLSCLPSRPVPVLMMNGTSDPVVPYKGGTARIGSYAILSAEDSAKSWSKLDICPAKPQRTTLPPRAQGGMQTRVDTYDDCHAGAEIALYSIQGGGNTWPGGEQYMPEDAVGKTSNDVNADEIIWKFFEAHRLPASDAPAR